MRPVDLAYVVHGSKQLTAMAMTMPVAAWCMKADAELTGHEDHIFA